MGSRTGSQIAGVRALVATLVPALAALALLPASASAASVAKNGGSLDFNAAANESNQLNVTLAAGSYTFDDAGANLTAGAGCTAVDANTVTCPAAGVTRVAAFGGNMNDFLRVGPATASTLFGSEGNDTLISGDAGDVLVGCQGDDTLQSNGGADVHADSLFCPGGGSNEFLGGDGNDTLYGGPEFDVFNAGNGEDDVRAADGGSDSVNCGGGFDVGAADFEDSVALDCEDIAFSGQPPDDEFFDDFGFGECLPPEEPVQDDGEFLEDFELCLESSPPPCASLSIRGRRASLRGGAVEIRVRLARSASGVCRAKLRLEALSPGAGKARSKPRRQRIGAAPFSLRPGRTKAFEVELSRSGKRLAQRRGEMRIAVSALSRGEGSGAKLDSAVLKLSAR